MSAPAAQRLFFALWPDESARAALARLSAEVAGDAGGRAPREGNLHVTVAFLGGIAAERVPRLEAAGEHACSTSSPFVLSLDSIGGNRQGVVWIAPAAAPPQLHALHASLRDALRQAGFVTERREFRPHVTLARNCPRPARRMPVAPVRWAVERLSLVASTPAPGGSRYTDLASWPLAGAQSTGTV